MKTFKEFKAADPCPEGLAFAVGHHTLKQAWDACYRPDWLLWFVGRHEGTSNLSAQFAKECADRAAAAEWAAAAARSAARSAAAEWAEWAAEREWQCQRIREIFSYLWDLHRLNLVVY